MPTVASLNFEQVMGCTTEQGQLDKADSEHSEEDKRSQA
jgi:hypothetical protein